MIIFYYITLVFSYNCFTMPPKVSIVSGDSPPDIYISTYKHDVHSCPYGNVLYSSYGNLVRDCSNSTSSSWNVMSYAVCCEGGIIHAINTLL